MDQHRGGLECPDRPFLRSRPKARRRRSVLPETGWNSPDPEKVSLAYMPDGVLRNRAGFLSGRAAIVFVPTRKWTPELDYRLDKEPWAHDPDRIAVRFA